ncbi:MAG: hypothetical protein JRG86_03140 [Deltaproteobacteria bacterium]|jgi:hypothetical protein|nr:hypothetical protein [Deltaproteobacteria bacterium]MBW2497585.1 hypothetical protein [Deltaproteobacteria bacterium]
MNFGRIRSAIGGRFLGILLSLFACYADATYPERDEQVMLVLDRYMDALNELDLEGHVGTYHFPHFRHASGAVVVWETPEDAMPILLLPEEERRSRLRDALGPKWERSEWRRREIVQGDDEKVHVLTAFVRLREDGSEIARYDSLYVLTLEQGHWGIKGRSSFAP